MKHLKTTIKLSVLALACLGAGALALQPTAYAKAEDSADCLTMQNGASVCVKDDFSGIRWTTKVDFEKYQTLCGAGKTIQFGTLVLPTDMLGDDGVLTDADVSAGALDIPANIDVDNIANDTEFYTIVNYDNLAEAYEGTLSEEDALKKAYALELTARSYVKVNGVYYFAEEMGTSRSARQVALAAELAGDWDETEEAKAIKAAKYYGMSARYTPAEVSNGAAGTMVVDLEKIKTADEEVLLHDMQIEGEIESVFVGAERVKYKSYTKDSTKILTFEIAEGQILPVGETYVSVFTDEGVYTKPIICATKVLTTTDDLAMFSAKGGYGAYSSKASAWDDGDYWRASQEQSGYYVLGGNIDANSYVHGSRIADDYATVTGEATSDEFNNGTWNGASVYVDKPIGLTGTFNGLGYTIDGMTIGSQREGFFGIVNGGTVKNVAFNDVKATEAYNFVIANYLINAKIDNVYIAINARVANDENNPGYAINKATGILGAYAMNDTKLSNIFIRLNSQSTAKTTFGALFGSTHSDESYTCDNVFVYGRTHFQYVVGTTAPDETTGEETTTYANTTLSYYAVMVTASHASAAKDENGNYTSIDKKGTLYLAENQVVDPDAKELTAVQSKISTDVYNLKVIKGVYLYTQSDKGHVTGTWADHDYANFFASGCWEANDKIGV
ncbi:MAG: hypothetical protein IJD33_03485, partial [Clostridia bacterium]|nr:hypothetical protein [Clostridia bacterium]